MHLKKAGQYSRSCSDCYSVYCTTNGYGCASVIVSDCRRGRRTAHGCSVQTSSPHALQSTSAMTLILKWVFWNCFFFFHKPKLVLYKWKCSAFRHTLLHVKSYCSDFFSLITKVVVQWNQLEILCIPKRYFTFFLSNMNDGRYWLITTFPSREGEHLLTSFIKKRWSFMGFFCLPRVAWLGRESVLIFILSLSIIFFPKKSFFRFSSTTIRRKC